MLYYWKLFRNVVLQGGGALLLLLLAQDQVGGLFLGPEYTILYCDIPFYGMI